MHATLKVNLIDFFHFEPMDSVSTKKITLIALSRNLFYDCHTMKWNWNKSIVLF